MNFVFALMVCFIWAEISYSQMNKVTGWDTSKIKEEIAVLKENADELIKVTDNDNRSNSDGSCQNSLEVGLRLLRPQISALNKQMILLKEQLKKSLKTKTQTPVWQDCAEICSKGIYPSGIYTINPKGKNIKVYCDMKTAGGGWTVFQRRVDGKTDFWRTWEDYKQGFGNLETNFWLGNDNLHLLTHITGRRQLLLIELVDKEGNTPCAQYSKFLIASEADKYRLTVGGYSGNAGDSLDTKNGWSANDMAFTTKDRDNDQNGGNCGATERGGWWYRSCQAANLNGIYNGPNVKGINWYYYKMNRDSFRRSEMKFRPIDFEGCQQKTENRKPKLPWVPRFGK